MNVPANMDLSALKSRRPVTRSITAQFRLEAGLQARALKHEEEREAHRLRHAEAQEAHRLRRVRRHRRREAAHDQEGWKALRTRDTGNSSDETFDSESHRDEYGPPPGIGLTSEGDVIEEMTEEGQSLYWADVDNFHYRFQRWKAGERVSRSVSDSSETPSSSSLSSS